MAAEHLPVSGTADLILGLGVALRPDGASGAPTAAVARKVIELYRLGAARRILLCGGYAQAGVSEAEAMRRLLAVEGITEGIWLDEAPDHVQGTPRQPVSVERLLRGVLPSYPETVVLVAHPLHLPRAVWLFRKSLPAIEFIPIRADEVYDTTLSQRRLHSRWRFWLWNCLAWVHHRMFVVMPEPSSIQKQDR